MPEPKEGDLEHCCKCGKEVSAATTKVAKLLGASYVVCENCSPIGGSFA